MNQFKSIEEYAQYVEHLWKHYCGLWTLAKSEEDRLRVNKAAKRWRRAKSTLDSLKP